MNSVACCPSGKFASKLEASQYQLVWVGNSRKDNEGWLLQTTMIKEAWNQSRTFLYAGVSFVKAMMLAKS